MALSLLLDTCIWLDDCIGDRPGAQESRELIDYCLNNDIGLLYSALSLQNVEYVVVAYLKRQCREQGEVLDKQAAMAIQQLAAEQVSAMLQLGTCMGIDASDIWLARSLSKQHHDFEDYLVMTAMERSGATALVTNDTALIKHSPYVACTPADALTYLQDGVF